MTLESNEHIHKTENSWCQVFLAILASFGLLVVISDPHVNFQNSRNGCNAHKGPENINYFILKYGVRFTAPTRY